MENLKNQLTEAINSGQTKEDSLFPYEEVSKIANIDALTAYIACDRNVFEPCVPYNGYNTVKKGLSRSITITNGYGNILSNLNMSRLKIFSLKDFPKLSSYNNFKTFFALSLKKNKLSIYDIFFMIYAQEIYFLSAGGII